MIVIIVHCTLDVRNKILFSISGCSLHAKNFLDVLVYRSWEIPAWYDIRKMCLPLKTIII